jgi:biopolymer transport protein TolQ
MLKLIQTVDRGNNLGILVGYDIFTNAIMLCLLVLSIYSWAAIIHKSGVLKAAARANRKFMERFKKRQGVGDPFTESLTASPGFSVLAEGLAEAQRLSGGEKIRFSPEVLPNVQAAMERETVEQVERLSHRLISLAPIATVSPLLGLLGTVWGIMIAFLDIKRFGSTSIQVVAPGIAEALVTTIAGLVVAIPAAMAYNAFTSRIRSMSAQMDNLSSEFLGDLRIHSMK